MQELGGGVSITQEGFDKVGQLAGLDIGRGADLQGGWDDRRGKGPGEGIDDFNWKRPFQAMDSLQECDCAAQVSITAFNQGSKRTRVRPTSDPLRLRNHLQSLHRRRSLHRSEAEFGAAARDGVDDAADVVADDAEAGGAAVLLDGAAEGGLGVRGQAIRFIQDD